MKNFSSKEGYLISESYANFQMNYITKTNSVSLLANCFCKGIVVFCASFGCVSGFLTAFDIAYSTFLVAITFFIISMLLSILHSKKILFNTVYPVLFLIFAYTIIKNRLYVNSGFQAIINIINESFSSHFLMNFTRESTEAIENRMLTITFVAIFLGIFLIVLIQMATFHDMLLFPVILLTMTPLLIPIYIGKRPSFLSLLLLLFSYFSIFLLKRSTHIDAKDLNKNRRKRGRLLVQGTQPKVLLQITLISLLFSFCTTSICYSGFQTVVPNSYLKELTEPYVKSFVQNGMAGFFNRYTASGGLSNGRLGGVSGVQPDYQTDLTVSFVPYSYEPIYLKAFTSSTYVNNQWLEPYQYESNYQSAQNEDFSDKDIETISFHEANILQNKMDKNLLPYMNGKMEITNKDAAINHLYLPYFAKTNISSKYHLNNYIIDGALPIDTTLEVRYLPYAETVHDVLKSNFKNNVSETFTAYQEEVYDNYLQIPDTLQDELTAYHATIGTGKTVSEQISLLRNFFVSNYTYSFSPGITPVKEDFVLYFLKKQKQGYCAHFASAATMLLRSYGIPTRYVEGYVITQSAIANRAYSYEGTNTTDDFYKGEITLDQKTLITLDVLDADAHAWCEVFIDDFGWIPVDLTPPGNSNDEYNNSDFLNILSFIFSENYGSSQSSNLVDSNTTNTNFSKIEPDTRTLIIFSVVFILFFIITFSLPLLLPYLKSGMAYNKAKRHKDYGFMINMEYQKTKRFIEKKKSLKILLPSDMIKILVGDLGISKEIAESMLEATSKACFSASAIDAKHADEIINFYRHVRHI